MRINEIKTQARQAHRDASLREQLILTLLNHEGREAYHAAWTLTHLPASDTPLLEPHRNQLVDKAITTSSTTLRRLTLALLNRLPWTVEAIRTDLLDFCLLHLADPSEADGVRSLCIKLSYAQCQHFEPLRNELRQHLLMLDHTQLKPGLKHTHNQTLKQL